jgi:transposase-like protein
MPGQRARVFSREFKEAAVRRMLGGEKVRALAEELRVWPKLLYAWRESFERGGPEALLPPGRPRNSVARAKLPSRAVAPRRRPGTAPDAQERIAALERKVGQQALELDFFARALRHVKAPPRPNDGSGATASSPSSPR